MASKLTARDLAMLSLLAWHFDSKTLEVCQRIRYIHFRVAAVNRSAHCVKLLVGVGEEYKKPPGEMYVPDTLANFEGSLRKLLGLLERDVIRGDAVLFITSRSNIPNNFLKLPSKFANVSGTYIFV
jgi:hypothetical protein